MVDKLLFPLAVISINLLAYLPGGYYTHQVVFIYILMILLMNIPSIVSRRVVTSKWCIIIAILISFQIVAIFWNVITDMTIISPFTLIYKLLIFIACILIHYIILRIRLNGHLRIINCIKGIRWSLILVIVVNLCQLGYLVYPIIFEPVVTFTSNNLEFQWGDFQDPTLKSTVYYGKGTYVQTDGRLNGLTEETSTNGIMIGLLYMPFILASLQNKYNIFTQSFSVLEHSCYLVLLMIILIFSQSFLAIIVILITVFFLIKIINVAARTVLLSIVGLLVIVALTVYSDIALEYLDKTALNRVSYESVSMLVRSGYTLAAVETAIEHPFLGVGWQLGGSYIFENIPDWARDNSEYDAWINYDIVPLLSSLPQLCVEFGIVFVGYVIIYSIKLLRRWKSVLEKISMTDENYLIIKVLYDAYKMFLLFAVILLFSNVEWYKSSYLLLYFFFVNSLLYYENKINNDIKF